MNNKEEILAKLQDVDVVKSAKFNMEEDYQRCILALLLSDKNFLIESANLIQPSYFSNKNHQIISKLLANFYNNENALPNAIILKQAIRDEIKDNDSYVNCVGELNSLYEYYVPGAESRNALRNRILKFAKTQALKQAFNKSFDLLIRDFESDETWTKIHEIYRDAVTIDIDFNLGLDYFNNLEKRYDNMAKDLNNTEKFTTGFETIDNSLSGGGMCRGEIYAVMGMPGTGKSLALTTCSIKNLVAGKKVMYISCEMSEDKIAERFDAQFANEAIWQLYDRRDMVISAIQEQVSDLEDKRQLVIKQFPGGMADVNTIRAYHNQMKMRGFIPDLVVVDYIGEMKDAPGLKTYESRFRIVRDLRGFATEEGFLCLTAMQPNRSARELQEDPTKYIDDDNLADAFGQTRPLDGLWSINQSINEKKASVARGFIVKSRSGKSRIDFMIGYDDRTLMMREITKEQYKGKMSLVVQNNVDKTKEQFKKKKDKDKDNDD